MATLAVQDAIPSTGVQVTEQAAAAGGDTFPNTGREVLVVNNGSGAPITVTVTATGPCNQGVLHNSVSAIPAGQRWHIGPFPPARFGDTPAISYSGVTSLTIAARRIP